MLHRYISDILTIIASLAAKGDFITSLGLAGFAMWHAAGDSDDILLDSIGKAIVEGGGERGGNSC
jgi:chitinase